MISDFLPIPSPGEKYRKPDGTIIEVVAFNQNLGGIPDFVEYIISPNDIHFEATAEEWTNMNLQPIDDAPSASDSDSKSESESKSQSEYDVKDSEEISQTDKEIPKDNILDEKVEKLEKLLNNGPNFINPEYFPTDFAKDLPENDMVEKDAEKAFQNTIDEINDKRRIGRKLNGGCINEFLWTCAGVDKPLLRVSPTDWAKKAGLGGTILGTAILAAVSGGYAAYTVFESYIISAIVGIIWALIIFNLDRYLVNSMVSDGKSTISKEEFKSAIPRIIIAIFLGIVISTPIEIRIFDGKIQSKLVDEKNAFIKVQEKIALEEYHDYEKKLKHRIDSLNKEVKIVDKCMALEDAGYVYDRATGEAVLDEKGNKIKNKRGAGQSNAYKSLGTERATIISLSTAENQLLKNHEAKKENLIDTATQGAVSDFKGQVGLSKKIELLLDITKFRLDNNPMLCAPSKLEINPLWFVRLLIALLFIIIEVLPVFNKMMQEAGWYDKWIDLENKSMEQLARVKEFNHINVLRTGNLSRYRTQILGYDIVDEDEESDKVFMKSTPLKDKKDLTDEINTEIYTHAIKQHKDYIIGRIDNLYHSIPQNTGNKYVKEPETDKSDEAIKI